MTEPIIVDNSTLTAMATCPTQAALRYVLGLTMDEDRGPLVAGRMAHAILAEYPAGATVDEALRHAEVVAYLEWATASVEANDRLSGENVTKIMRRWMETHPVSGLPFTVQPELVEVGFAVPLDDDVIFVGRMDALARDSSGAWYVIEHKTTGWLNEQWRKRFKTSGQIT